MMVGRKLENEFPKQRAAIGEDRLVVRNLSRVKRSKAFRFRSAVVKYWVSPDWSGLAEQNLPG